MVTAFEVHLNGLDEDNLYLFILIFVEGRSFVFSYDNFKNPSLSYFDFSTAKVRRVKKKNKLNSKKKEKREKQAYQLIRRTGNDGNYGS